MEEAKDFHLNGMGESFMMQRDLDVRGFLAITLHTGQHTAVFLKSGLDPVLQDQDPVYFHHAIAIRRVSPKAFPGPVTFMSAHLCPFGGQLPQGEACYWAGFADPDQMVLVIGDFNSVAPSDAEPAWETLPPQFRSRYVDADSGRADRKALQTLLQAGYVEVAAVFGKSNEVIVSTASFTQVEFVPFRSDYILVTRALADCAKVL